MAIQDLVPIVVSNVILRKETIATRPRGVFEHVRDGRDEHDEDDDADGDQVDNHGLVSVPADLEVKEEGIL